MKNTKFPGIAALVAVIVFSLIACDQPTDSPKNKNLSGSVIISPSENVTTGTELTATYIGTETVALSWQWKKDGSNVGTNAEKFTPTEAGSYTVTVSAKGYNPKTSDPVAVSATVSPSVDITYTVEQTGGTNNTTDSTGIVFTFSASVDSFGLTADNITVDDNAAKGANAALTGEGTTRTLSPITVTHAGQATVQITKTGIAAGPQHVTVYKANETAPVLQGITVVYAGGSVAAGTDINSLKSNLTVTAQYDKGGDQTLSAGDYGLSGDLIVGESTITVTYQGKIDTFKVTVFIPIANAEIHVTAPVNSGIPDDTAGGDGFFTIGAVTWEPSHNPFQGETRYRATVTLTAEEGHMFVNSVTATVNGEAAEISANTGAAVTLSYLFPATDARKPTAVSVTAQPTKLTYTHNEALDLTGITVHVTYDNGDTENYGVADFTAHGITANPAQGNHLVRSSHNGHSVEIRLGNLTPVSTNTLTVNAKAINAAGITVAAIAAVTYNGSAHTPAVTVEDGTTVLTPTTDYTVGSYTNNTNAGNAGLTITGVGNYTGTRTANFTINKATGSAVSALTASSVSRTNVNLNVVTLTTTTGQTREYARSTDTTVPTSGWQTTTAFTVTPGTTNYFFARAAESTNYSAGAASISAAIRAESIVSAAVTGVTHPVPGATPVTTIETDQYTGTVSWQPNHATYAASTQYTATITLTAKTADGYTLQGAEANRFTVAGTFPNPAANAANSGVITAVFQPFDFVIINAVGSSTTEFTLTRNGHTVGDNAVLLSTILTRIWQAAGTNPINIIQLGNGTTPLDSGTTGITLGTSNVGLLTGGITTSNTYGSAVQISNVSVTSTANITNTSTGDSSVAVQVAGTGNLTISGGTISSLAAGTGSGATVRNTGTGTITISGGTVSAGAAAAVRNNSTGTIIISGGVVTSETDYSISGTVHNNAAGFIEIDGGTVSNTAVNASARAVWNYDNGTITIKSGTVSAATGVAVFGQSNTADSPGKIIVSGGTVTSENITTSYGTIYIRSGNIEISGGTVRNTANNANARAAQVGVTGNLTISGGTIEAVGAGAAVRVEGLNKITLSGNPTITGNILANESPTTTGALKIETPFNPPTGQVYTFVFNSGPSAPATAVEGGGPYSANFALGSHTPAWKLEVSGSDLRIVQNN